MTKNEKIISNFIAKWNDVQTNNEVEFKSFVSDFKKAVKAVCEENGIDKSAIKFSVGHFYISGFIKTHDNASSPYVYFSVSDTRSPMKFSDFAGLMYRTAEHERDFTGGSNHWGGLADMAKFVLNQ